MVKVIAHAAVTKDLMRRMWGWGTKLDAIVGEYAFF
jgi:hypothetical protein